MLLLLTRSVRVPEQTLSVVFLVTFKPQADGDRGEEASERPVFRSVWRKASEPTSRDRHRRGGHPPGVVSPARGARCRLGSAMSLGVAPMFW